MLGLARRNKCYDVTVFFSCLLACFSFFPKKKRNLSTCESCFDANKVLCTMQAKIFRCASHSVHAVRWSKINTTVDFLQSFEAMLTQPANLSSSYFGSQEERVWWEAAQKVLPFFIALSPDFRIPFFKTPPPLHKWWISREFHFHFSQAEHCHLFLCLKHLSHQKKRKTFVVVRSLMMTMFLSRMDTWERWKEDNDDDDDK